MSDIEKLFKLYSLDHPKRIGNLEIDVPLEDLVNYITERKKLIRYAKIYEDVINILNDGDVFVELGVWTGRSLLHGIYYAEKANKKLKFYAVDSWAGDKTSPKQLEQVAKIGGPAKMYELFVEYAKVYKTWGKFIPIRKHSIQAVKEFEDEVISFLFIDAGHSYEDISQDIKLWYPKIKPGGIISGHDYNLKGVPKAVNEFFGKKNIEKCPGNCWKFTKPNRRNFNSYYRL